MVTVAFGCVAVPKVKPNIDVSFEFHARVYIWKLAFELHIEAHEE